MSALKDDLIERINEIPDNKLAALKPLIYLLSGGESLLEKITEDDLSLEELEAVRDGNREYALGECVDFDDYLASRSE